MTKQGRREREARLGNEMIADKMPQAKEWIICILQTRELRIVKNSLLLVDAFSSQFQAGYSSNSSWLSFCRATQWQTLILRPPLVTSSLVLSELTFVLGFHEPSQARVL